MPRTPRTAADGDWHHVMNRGARRLPIFGDDRDRAGFLGLLGDAASATDLEVHAYALMDNHFHLLVRAPVRELAKAMQSVLGSFTRRFNARYGLDGALFRGRYRSKPVDTADYLRDLVRYIHRNPLPHDGRRGLEVFRWTSHLAYLGLARPPRWLRVDAVLESAFGGDRSVYREFVEDSDAEATDLSLVRTPADGVSPERIEWAVGVASAPERQLLRGGGRGLRNHQRLACTQLCRELTDLTAAQLAERYGYPTAAALRTAVSRARSMARTDPRYAAVVDGARRRLGLGDGNGVSDPPLQSPA